MDVRQSLTHTVGRFLDKVVMVVATIGLLAMMVHITMDVVLGLLLNSPLGLTSTYVTQYYMIAVAFLPIMAAEFRGAHISADLFVKRMSPGVQHVVGLLVLALCLGVYLMLTAQSWQQAMSKFSSGAFVDEHGSRVVVWPSFFMLPVGFGLSSLIIASRLILEAMGAREPPHNDESQEEFI